jgi:MFS family permease
MSGVERGAVGRGFDALSHGKLILLLVLVSILLGIAGASPLFPALEDSVAGTLAGDHFLRNAPTLAPADFFDFLKENRRTLEGARSSSRWAGLLGIAFQIFLAGGLVAVLGRGPFGFGQLLEPARRNLWHNVKCFFLFALALVVAESVWLGGGFYARRKLFETSPPDAASHRLSWWLLIVGAFFIYAVLSILYDFARAARRFSPTIGAWRGFRFARSAASAAWTRALGIWLVWFVLGGVAWLGLLLLAWLMPAVSPLAILVNLLLLAGALAARSAARVAAWGSWVAFLEPRARAAVAETVRIRYTVARPVPPATVPET